MVKEGNSRMYFTASPKTLAKLKELCEKYDMTITELIKYLVNKELN